MVVKQTPAIRRLVSVNGNITMIEAVTTVLGLFSAGIFVAHAVEAYRAH
jgi:ABC-type uncharacterized transport system permease subunit